MPVKGLRLSFLQFVKFNMVGVVNTAVDFAVFAVLAALGVGDAVAQTFSYSAGMVNSYLMNTRFTFYDQKATNIRPLFNSKQFIRFFLLNLLVLAVSVALLKILILISGISVLLAKLGVTCATLVLNFIGSRLWVYRKIRYLPGED